MRWISVVCGAAALALTITAAPAPPLISRVVTAEGEAAVIAPNTWVEVKGSNLAPAGDIRVWQGSDFRNGQMPTSLDGVSVTVNGRRAFLYYISPTQVNILTPPEALPASTQVVVTNNGAAGAPFTAAAQSISPSFFVFSDNQHVAAVHANGDLVGAASLSIPGYTFSPAQPGEVLEIYANGFGPTSTPVVPGSVMQGGTLSPLPAIKVGGIPATVQFAGLVFPGEYQFNVVIPANVPGGDQPIVASYNGSNTQSGTVITIAGTPPPASLTYYVAPDGSDSWSGTLAAPNSTNSDGPFASFDRARAAVQSLNKAGLSQASVQFRGGTYFLPATEQFASADSGTANLSVVYRNYPGETPVISGGMQVRNWTNAGGNTWRAVLPASTQYFENLFYNGARRLRPRIGGYLGAYLRVAASVYLTAPGPPAAAPDPNCPIYVSGSGWECFDRFQYNPADPIAASWKNLSPPAGNACGKPAGTPALVGDIELVDFEKFQAAKLRVSCVDTTKHIVYLTGTTLINAGFYQALGFIPQHRYLIENVQDALTQPGQWFLDRSATPWTLTYLANPGEDPNRDTVIVPQLAQLLAASNLQYVTFQGLTFAHDNYTVPAAGVDTLIGDIPAAVSFQNSRSITFDSGVVTQTSGVAIEFLSCLDSTSPPWCLSNDPNAVTADDVIRNSAFYDTGASGIRIGIQGRRGDTEANLPQFITIENNVVEGYGRTFPTLEGILQGEGHNNLYTHNDVYDGYHGAIAICNCSGYKPDSHDNVISFNHVYDLLQGILNDGGSIRIQSNNGASFPSPPGNKIVNNKIHDVSDASALDADGYGGDGVYIDNFSGLIDVENNLVYRVSGSALQVAVAPPQAGEASTIQNNIFAFARTDLVQETDPDKAFSTLPPPSPILSFALSHNLFYFDRSAASTPATYVQGGCTYSGGFPYTSYQQWSSNLYWRADGGFAKDPQAFHTQPNPVSPANSCFGPNAMAKWVFYDFAGWQKTGEDASSVVQDAGFAGPAYPNDDYRLPQGSPGAGFIPFDPSEAGRSNPVIEPPAVPATFPTKTFNPATDY